MGQVIAMPFHPTPDESTEADRLQQYEIVWIFPSQHQLPSRPDGFGLEIEDFLGPGDPDHRGARTVWVRGRLVETAMTSSGIQLLRGEQVTVALAHDQPRVRRTGGGVLRPDHIPTPRA
jgi:hypothetical protein